MRRLASFGVSALPLCASRGYNVRASPNQGGSQQYSGQRRNSFELFEVSDEPAKGFMLRVAYEEKRIFFTLFPQLGPRKVDPMDPAPQFDLDARQAIRLYPEEFAGLLAVCEGHAAKQRVSNNMRDIVFEKLPSNVYILSGTVTKNTTPRNIQISFNGYRFTMLKHFLEASLDNTFGFDRIQARNHRNDQTRGNGKNPSSV